MRSEGNKLTAKGHEKLSDVTEMIYIFIVVVVTGLYTLVKIHYTVHLKYVSFTICKLYLNKANKKDKMHLCDLQKTNLKPSVSL